MWIPTRLDWKQYAILCNALQNGNLVLVVGNGLSRLAGAPSWRDLFHMPAVVEALRAEAIDPATELANGMSLLEIAEVLPDTGRNHIHNLLKTWNDSSRPTLVHDVLFRLLVPASIYTFNFDNLLERARGPVNLPEVKYLHGSLQHPAGMMLSESEYASGRRATMATLISAAARAEAVLFIGYGHSYEDFDVRRALSPSNLKRANIRPGILFTLVSTHECTPVLRKRLERSQIQPLMYSLPANAPAEARILALASALVGFAEDSLGNVETRNRASDLLEQVNSLYAQQEERNRSTAIVIGLSAMNRISEPRGEDAYPSGARKNVRAIEIEEPGGPGLIVAKILSSLGLSATLVSTLVDDANGLAIRRYLEDCQPSETAVDLDYLHVYRRWEPGNEARHTWSSYVLLHPIPWGQRTFLDRDISPGSLPKSGPEVDHCADLIRDYPPQFIYFDKFYEDAVKKLLLRPGGMPLSEETITVYETGSDGDRANNYSFENHVAKQTANIVLSSFRFARDYLAHAKGQLDQAIWSNLAGGNRLEGQDEANLIGDKILKDLTMRQTLVEAVRRGALNWLRSSHPRVVVVTLHQHGCLWIQVDKAEDGIVPVLSSTSWNNFSAGDVFRGSFLAGMIALRRKMGVKLLASKEILGGLCELANNCAKIKVESRSVTVALPKIQREFIEWTNRTVKWP